jgi:hypothetical protein
MPPRSGLRTVPTDTRRAQNLEDGMEETPMKLLCALANRAALPRQLDHTVVPGEARSSIRHYPTLIR